MLERLRPASSQTDHLFVGTDRYTCFTASWNAQTKSLQTGNGHVDLADIGARDTQTGEKCLMDPHGQFILLEIFEGVITVLPILGKTKGRKKAEHRPGEVGDSLPTRIPELFIRSMTFLHGAPKPKLALLWEDGQKKVHLTAKELTFTGPGASDTGSVELRDTGTVISNLQDQGASHIIPVPEPVRMCCSCTLLMQRTHMIY